MSNDQSPLLELDDVKVHFNETDLRQKLRGEEEIVKAVDGINLEIEQNDVVAIVGESGCGKTTLGKTAIGLRRPTGGAVKYRGQDIWKAKDGDSDGELSHKEIRRSMQIIHQDPGSSLNPNRAVLANLLVPLNVTRPDMDATAKERRVYQLLEYLGLKPPEDYANRYPHQLSGGEQQRVALGRALLMEPDVILADEAVSALDVSLRVEMMDLMLDLQEVFDTSFLFISHDFANARYFAEAVDGRIGVMYLGRLVEIGPAEQLIHDPQHPYTKVLTWATPVLDPDLAEKQDPDPPIRGIDIPDPVNPPSGCSFHTRCPEACEVCTEETPQFYNRDGAEVACFRMDDTHEYWDSEPLADEEEVSQ